MSARNADPSPTGDGALAGTDVDLDHVPEPKPRRDRQAVRTAFSLWSNIALVLVCAGWFIAVRSPASQVVLGMAAGSASHSLLINRLSIRRHAITVVYRLAGCNPTAGGVASWHRALRSMAAIGIALGVFGLIGGTVAMIDNGSNSIPTEQVSSSTSTGQ